MRFIRIFFFVLGYIPFVVCTQIYGQDSSIVSPVVTATQPGIISYSSDTNPTYVRKKRIRPVDSSQLTTIIDSSILFNADDSTFSGNPFDFDYNSTTKTETVQEPIQNIVTPKTLKKTILNKDNYSKNFNFWVLMALLLILALLLRNARSAIKSSYNGFINNSTLRLLLNENGSYGTLDFVQMNIFYWLGLGFFVFQLLSHFDVKIHSSQFISLLICMVSTITLMVLKHLVLILIGSVYPLDKEMKSYSFIILVTGVLLGLILLPLNLIIAFSTGEFQEYTIYITLGIIASLYLVRSIKAILINANAILSYVFHFLLYLCAIETSPILILYRFIRNKVGF